MAQVPDDSLIVAELKETVRGGKRFKRVSFSPLPGTWRERAPETVNPVSKGKLMAYLNPVMPNEIEADFSDESGDPEKKTAKSKIVRVVDRPDLRFLPVLK